MNRFFTTVCFGLLVLLNVSCEKTSNDFSFKDEEKKDNLNSNWETALFDYIVKAGNVEDFKAALTAANLDKTTKRYRIFLPAGEYNLGNVYGTAVKRSQVSIIGESMEKTIIRNNPPEAGIGITATVFIDGASDTYIQDITLKNDWPYVEKGGGVAVCLQDKGDKTILKHVKMLSYQDTYFSDNRSMRSYLEDCEIHGTVDFICGGGDVFFNRNLLYLESRSGNVIAAPRGETKYGYVFKDCIIDGAEINNNSYCLGRPWSEAPKTVFLNTTMKVIPTSAGWTNMGPLPALFAEYNSHTSDGSAIDYTKRKKIYRVNNIDTPYNGPTVLTDAQAAEYTIENVLKGTDYWAPNVYTTQLQAPAIEHNNNVLTWPVIENALCYVIYKDGVYVAQTIEERFSISVKGIYMVYAVNKMGGLSMASNAMNVSAI